MTTNLLKLKAYLQTIYTILLLSISSVDFYKDVRTKYKGYGIKYIFTICMLASILFSIKLINQIYYFKDALTHKNNPYIENILMQVPEIKYDGKTIETLIETPYFIEDSLNHKIIAIDPNGNLSFSQRSKIPVILNKTKIGFFVLYNNEKSEEFSLNYSNFLGTSAMSINPESLREYILNSLDINGTIWLYSLPIMSIIYFIKICAKIIIPSLLLYFLANLYGINMIFKTSARLVMFSSGVFLLSQSLISFFLPSLIFIADIIHIISASLLVMSLAKKNNSIYTIN